MPRPAPHRIHRVLAGAALLLLVVGATGCNPGAPPAATVGGTEISAEHVDAVLEAVAAANPEAEGEILGQGADTFNSAVSTNVLTFLISQVAAYDIAVDRGLVDDDTETDDAAAQEYLVGQLGGSEEQGGNGQAVLDALDAETEEWLLGIVGGRIALADDLSADTSIEDLARQEYERQIAADPTVFDAVCLRLLVVPAEDIPEAQDRLAQGEDFGDVSADMTAIAEIAEARGENPCLPVSSLGGSEAAIQLLEAAPGDVIGPTPYTDPATGEEYQALLERGEDQSSTFEDVQDQIIQQLEQSGAGSELGESEVSRLVQEALEADPPTVDPRFGTWVPGADGFGGEVVPPRGARPATPVVEELPAGDATADTATQGG